MRKTTKQEGLSTLSNGGVKSSAVRAVSFCFIGAGIVSNFPVIHQQDSSMLRRNTPMPPDVNVSNTTFLLAGFHNDSDDEIKLDFFVSGFPKCGTTSLLRTFEQHSETVIPHVEECSLDVVFQDERAYNRLRNNLKGATNSTAPNIKRGIKCPFGLTTPKAIGRLEKWYPSTKLIYGLRHPVYYFQSFYNYRVLEVHQGKLKGPIPPPESLIGSNHWIRVSTDSARYEKVALEKLGKTSGSEPPTPFKVFLYTLEQMEDKDVNRIANLRKTLGTFLELKNPIEPLPRANQNKFVGEKGFSETINICDAKHNTLRSVLVENGKATQQWILNEFLMSPDVTVANEEHFYEILSTWGSDPCVKESEGQAEK